MGRGLEKGTDHIPSLRKAIHPCLPRSVVLIQVSPVPALLLNGVEYRVGYARVVGAVTDVCSIGGAHWKVLLPAAEVCGAECGSVRAGAWTEGLTISPAHIKRCALVCCGLRS